MRLILFVCVRTWREQIIVSWLLSPHHHDVELQADADHALMLRALSRARRANTYLGFRPSDDACKYPFLVPANMFAVVTLGHLAEIAEHVYHKPALALRQQIDDGTKLRKTSEAGNACRRAHRN
jgi:meiotically up-regulated gene 157 (Mug157) protein